MTEETKHIRRGIPQERHSLLCSDCGFCPEVPRTEKRRIKEDGAPPAEGARGREEQSKSLKRKEGQVLDSTGEQRTVEQSILPPVLAAQPGRVLWVRRGWSTPMVGLVQESESEGTPNEVSPVLLTRALVLSGYENCPSRWGGSLWLP